MDINSKQSPTSEAGCCAAYCSTTYQVAGQEVVNNYKCNQPHFSAYDLWQIRRQRRTFALPTGTLLH